MKDEQINMLVVVMAVFTLVNILFTTHRVLEAEDLIIKECRCD